MEHVQCSMGISADMLVRVDRAINHNTDLKECVNCE